MIGNKGDTPDEQVDTIKEFHEAEQKYLDILNTNQSDPELKYHLSLVQLYKNNYLEGWKNFDYRWYVPNFNTQNKNINFPLYLNKKEYLKIYVWAEQGIGDQILFSRFLNDLLPRVKIVFSSVDNKLMELFTFFINLYYGLAAVMAFLIIANTATINMLEREREMATLKTLGTSDVILSKATSAENFVMGTIAGITGIVIGYPVAVWLLQTFTYEIYYVPTYFPSGLPIVMIICVVLLSVSATIPSWIRLRNMNLGNLVRSIER